MDPLIAAADPAAAATIEAARIAARATIRAAWIQAGAALGAIAAGALAYVGAVRQVRLQERAQEARTIAYRFRLSRAVDEYRTAIIEACSTAGSQLAAFRRDGASVEITSFQIVRPRTLHDDNWEVHALLGLRAVELILIVDDSALRLAAFDQQISEDDVRTDSNFERATVRAVGDGAGGGRAHTLEHAIVDYVAVLETLNDALTDLQTELAKSSSRISSRGLWLKAAGLASATPKRRRNDRRFERPEADNV